MITIFIPFLFVYFAYSKHIELKKKKAQVSKKKENKEVKFASPYYSRHIYEWFLLPMKICMENLPPNRSFDILCVLKSAIVFSFSQVKQLNEFTWNNIVFTKYAIS